MHVLARVGCCVALVMWVAPLAAQEIKAHKLSSLAIDFALDPETGNVAAVDPLASSVELYSAAFFDGDTKAKAAPIKVGHVPSTIVYKKFKQRGVFVVGCFDDSHLYLIDAARFTLLRKISLEQTGVRHVSCASDPADPYVYYAFGSDDGQQIGCVSLATLSDEGVVLNNTVQLAISARGRYYYAETDYGRMSVCRQVMRGGKPEFYHRDTEVEPAKAIISDGREAFVALGRNIYTPDLEKQIARLDFEVQSIHPARPLLFGLKGQDLHVASANTYRHLHRQPLPWPRQAEREELELKGQRAFEDGNGSVRFKSRVLIDARANRVIVGQYDRAVVVPLAALKLPDEPTMRVEIAGSTDLMVGAAVKLGLVKADPRVTVALVEPPAGVTLANEMLVIDPSADLVGEHTLQIALKHGELEVVQPLMVRVSQPFVRLPWRANLLAVDPAGKKAVCGWLPLEGLSEEWQRSTQLAVIDLAAKKIERTLTVPSLTSAIATDGVSAFLADAHDLSIHVVALADGKTRRLATGERYDSLTVIPEKLLYAVTPEGQVQRFLWQEGAWVKQATPELEEDARQFDRRAKVEPPRRVAGGWLVDGVLYDEQLVRARLIHQVKEIVAIGADARPGWLDDTPRKALSAWSQPVVPNRNYDPNGGWRSDGLHFPEYELDTIPARLSAAVLADPHVKVEREPLPTKVQLLVRDLQLGGSRETILIAQGALLGSSALTDDYGKLFHASASAATLAWGDRLFHYDLSQLDQQRYPRPLTLAPDQSSLTIDLQQKTKLAHKVGGKGKISAQLIDKASYLSIDPASGDVTIDGPALAALIERGVMTEVPLAQLAGDISDQEKILEIERALLERGHAEFTRIVGRKPVGMPLAVPIRVRLTTEGSGDDALMEYHVLAELPPERLRERLTAANAEALQRQAKTQANWSEGQARRLKQLEERMTAVEAKLDRIIEMLSNEKE